MGAGEEEKPVSLHLTGGMTSSALMLGDATECTGEVEYPSTERWGVPQPWSHVTSAQRTQQKLLRASSEISFHVAEPQRYWATNVSLAAQLGFLGGITPQREHFRESSSCNFLQWSVQMCSASPSAA